MRYPDFIPFPPLERSKREWLALGLEALLWCYLFLVVVRIGFGECALPLIEDWAFQDPPVPWAEDFIQRFELDSRKIDFTWSFWGTVGLLGSLFGLAIGLSSRGAGHWLMSLSPVPITDPDAQKQAHAHWKWAKREIGLVLLATVVTGWSVARIHILDLFHHDGLQGATRLALQLSCGIPGSTFHSIQLGGWSIDWGMAPFDVLQKIMNALIQAANVVFAWLESTPLERLQLTCEGIEDSYFSHAVSKLIESVYLAFMATFFSIPIAFIASFFAAKNLSKDSFLLRTLYRLIRLYMNVSRSIEPLIWAILFSVWVGIGPFAGAMALMIHSVSSLIKQYSEAVESVDNGPIEALLSTGASRIATIWYAVVPQVVLPYLAFTIYRWDINVRMATVIGLVGGGGIGGLLIQAQGLAAWNKVGTIAFLIFIVVWLMDALSAKMREAIQ